MALSLNQVWEVRTTGSDTNGGAFKAGATGTDYSQQDAAQVAVNNSTLTATTAGAASNVITFTGYTPTSADIGNVFQATGGTNITLGFYEITAQTASTWTVTGAANLTTAGGAGSAITGNMGGALLTLGKLGVAMVGSNKAFVKGGTYTQTATATLGAASVSPTSAVPATRLIGYTTSRGDNGRPTITLATNTGLTAISITNGGWIVENFLLNGSGLGTSTGIVTNANPSTIRNVKVTGTSLAAISLQGGGVVMQCEVTGCAFNGGNANGGGIALGGGNYALAFDNYVHDNTSIGSGVALTMQSTYGNFAIGNVIANNAGANTDAIVTFAGAGLMTQIYRNTIHGNGRDGIRHNGRNWSTFVLGNLLTNNGGYGFNCSNGAGSAAWFGIDGNAYWNNTSGTRNNLDDISSNPVNGVAPWTNVADVVLTGNPYTNSASNDLTLNNTAGAGAAARAVSPIVMLPGMAQNSYSDMGALQHQDNLVTMITSFIEG